MYITVTTQGMRAKDYHISDSEVEVLASECVLVLDRFYSRV